jgi:hypothetical protein
VSAEPVRGVCRFCACTEAEACDGGCSWADDAQTICSTCQAAAEIAGELVSILGIVATSPGLSLRIATPKWERLTLDQQRVLVMTCRATVDGIRQALLEAMSADAVEAGIELNIISGFLLEKCSDQIAEDDTPSQAVIRLLSPHIGSRIVLPDGARP